VVQNITPFPRQPGREVILPVGLPLDVPIQPEVDEPSRAAVVAFFLPMLDDLELVTVLAPRSIQHHPWVDALRLVEQRMQDGLAELGVTRFGDVHDAFDPAVHQVVWYEAVPDIAEIQIDAVIKQGYRIGDHAIRSAQVAVTGPLPATS
jgi:molecular chaperone GrpE